jgi:hypothetical protein
VKTVVKVRVRDYDRALATCNEVRRELGKRPVRSIKPGIPCDGNQCPIARTIGEEGWPLTSEQDEAVTPVVEAVDSTDCADGQLVHVQRGKRAA